VRSLSPDEAELWSRVAATIRPLSRESVEAPQAETPAKPVRTPQPSRPSSSAQPREKGVGTTLDGGWDRRLRSGDVDPDMTLDLHGMSLDRAWAAIDRTLERAIAVGARVVLLITGHHRPGTAPVERGKIRAAVHDWLAASRHAPGIAAVRGAHRRHGGGGGLYIILRRR